MKQAFLIFVHRDPDYVEKLINSLNSDRSNIYVHIDKKSESLFSSFFTKVKDYPNVHIFSEIHNNYLGIGIVQSIVFLIKESLKNEENGYFHILSGQDLLIKPINDLLDFFEENRNKCYLKHYLLPYEGWSNGGLERYTYYCLNDILNCDSKHIFNQRLNWYFVKIQSVLKIKRKPLPYTELYGGSAWWSMNRDASIVLNDFFAIEENWKYIKYTHIPDEMIFHTVLLNSHLRGSIVNDHLRYIDWSINNGSHPKTLLLEDYDKLKNSNSFICRKVDPVLSADLIERFSI